MDYTVGDLAKRSGLTVRTLHHYEQLGLLTPSGRSAGGYRLYAEADVRTLHRILAYRQMGLALKDIAPLLAPESAPPLLDILARQIATVRAGIAEQQRLLTTLERVERRAREDAPALTDDLLDLMSAQRIFERHYSPEELDRFRAMEENVGRDGLKRMRVEVDTLMREMRVALDTDQPVDAPPVRALARRWIALGDLLAEDESLREKGRAMLAQEPTLRQISGLDTALMGYIDRAIESAKAAQGSTVDSDTESTS